MPNNKAATPQKVGMMAVGAVGALALAYWSISNALAPGVPAAAQAATPAHTLSPTPPIPPDQSAAAPTMETPKPSAERATNSAEALLSPGVDPFTPFIQSAPQRGPGQTSPATPSAANTSPPVGSNPPPPSARPPASGLPSFGQLQVRSLEAPRMPSVAPAPEPELVGTLLGNRPSGVFRVDKQLAIVSVGGVIEGWKVLAIHHGEAIIKSMGQTLRLDVGMSRLSGAAPGPHTSLSVPMPVGNERTRAAAVATQTPGSTSARTFGSISNPAAQSSETASASSSASDGKATAPNPVQTFVAGTSSGADSPTPSEQGKATPPPTLTAPAEDRAEVSPAVIPPATPSASGLEKKPDASTPTALYLPRASVVRQSDSSPLPAESGAARISLATDRPRRRIHPRHARRHPALYHYSPRQHPRRSHRHSYYHRRYHHRIRHYYHRRASHSM